MGQGYVGLPLAMAAADEGHEVVGFEPDPKRYQRLANGDSFVEDVPSGALAAHLGSGAYRVANHLAGLAGGFDVAVIAVPTPLLRGLPDLRAVESAAKTVGAFLGMGGLVVLESTVAPGTTRDVVVPLLERFSGLTAGDDFHVGYSPERIDPGNLQWGFDNTPKIVGGLTSECAERAVAFYESITETVIEAVSMEAAEAAKVFENTFRQVNIALVNELARHMDTLKVDVQEVLNLAATKPFGFMKFTPGPGVGGHCLPVDPMYLAHAVREKGGMFEMVELAQRVNNGQPEYVVGRLQRTLNQRRVPMYGARVLALGLAYKPGTGDMRESPAVEVVQLLEEAGAVVTAVDPGVSKDQPRRHRTTPDVSLLAKAFDAVVVLTPHEEFPLAEIAASGVYVLDTRNSVPVRVNVEHL
jgi:UDP-N-acetyl-D-glucosamine dehydrogenase